MTVKGRSDIRPQVLSRVLTMALVLGVLPRGWLNAWTAYDMRKLIAEWLDAPVTAPTQAAR